MMLTAELRIPGNVELRLCVDTLDGKQPFGLHQKILAFPIGTLSVPSHQAPAEPGTILIAIKRWFGWLANGLEVLAQGDELGCQCLVVAIA